MSKFTQGDVARLSINVTDAANVAADPPALLVKIKPPTGALINASYPGTIVKTGVGTYRYDVVLAEKGCVAMALGDGDAVSGRAAR